MPSTSSANALSQFSGPMRLLPDHKRERKAVIFGTIFCALGVLLFSKIREDYGSFVAIGFLALFGIATVFSIYTWSSRRVGLILDQNGFEIDNGFLHWRHQWAHVSNFAIYTAINNRMIIFDDAVRKTAMGPANRILTGRTSWLPDTYGFDADDLVRLMTQWQQRALALQSR
jgi:hypothetical protein